MVLDALRVKPRKIGGLHKCGQNARFAIFFVLVPVPAVPVLAWLHAREKKYFKLIKFVLVQCNQKWEGGE